MALPILLIVEDEQTTREGLCEALEDRFDIYAVEDLEEARSVLRSDSVDVVLTDLRLGSENGMDLVSELHSKEGAPVSVVMTAYGSVDTAIAAVKSGAYHFVAKPLNLDEVELILLRAVQSRTLIAQNQSLAKEVKTLQSKKSTRKSKLDDIIGNSNAILKLKKVICQVAPTRANVLIQGESGTGKELIAQALHDLSGRKKLIIVNCAALPSQLLESELFGHEKGSFTDAKSQRIGRFEEAEGGTIFLDEIGEIDANVQVKLLRALSEKTIQRVGSNKSISVDARVIAATNKDLGLLVEDGEFREDLYFRLNVVKISPPPLRHRDGDLPLLCTMLLRKIIQENVISKKELSPEAIRLIESQEWPGNVRQLRAVLENAAILSLETQIQAKDLPQELISRSMTANKGLKRAARSEETRFLLREIERETILASLDHTSNNKTEAAKLLGISRRTLQRKLTEYNFQTF